MPAAEPQPTTTAMTVSEFIELTCFFPVGQSISYFPGQQDDIRQPTLLIRAPDDPFAAPHAAEWLAHLPNASVVDIAHGTVPLPDQLPQAFAQAVLHFLASRR